jgi:hypothetical protein
MPLIAALILAATAAAPATAQRAEQAPFLIEQSGRGYARLADAVAAIGDRAGTIRIAPGTYDDCAVQEGGTIAYVAVKPGTAIFDGGICEDKATLVLRGKGARVDGLVFQNLQVEDGNGAGIRIEHGNLEVANSLFRNSEEGILSADDPAASISVTRSTFSRLGRCDRGLSCAHSIYIGDYGSLTVSRSRFEKGNGGHYVKSRSRRTVVTDSTFDDTAGRTTNYMIDLPEGSTGAITGNLFIQGRDKENYSAFIAVAAEDRTYSSAGLKIDDNVAAIAPGVTRSTIFIANWSKDRLAIGDNRLGDGLTLYEKR